MKSQHNAWAKLCSAVRQGPGPEEPSLPFGFEARVVARVFQAGDDLAGFAEWIGCARRVLVAGGVVCLLSVVGSFLLASSGHAEGASRGLDPATLVMNVLRTP